MNLITPEELRTTLPRVSALAGHRFLVKYGGAAMEDDSTKELVCSEVAALTELGVHVVVVHGGGKEISRLIERLGLESHFIDGLRVTSPEVMIATEMVLSGTVNSDLVSRITRCGAQAVGLSGRDAKLLTARKLLSKRGEDLGQTGEVVASDPSAVLHALSGHFVPVISPVGEDRDGKALNLNADYAAGALAGSVQAEACIFLTDVAGVKKDDAVIPRLSQQEIAALIESGVITGGMIPKVECALRALHAGCPRAIITHAAKRLAITSCLVNTPECGTVIA